MIPEKLPDGAHRILPTPSPLSYRQARNQLQRLYKTADADDKKLISGMISDCEYAMEWLETGRRPGNKRGIERRAAYQREKVMDPLRMQAFVQKSTAGSPSNLTEWQMFQIEEALSDLSDRERECYIMSHGECFSQEKISIILNISRSSVEKYINRATVKISKNLNHNIFLI